MQINITFTITSILPRARREKQRNASGLACWLTEPLREYDESPQVNARRERPRTTACPPLTREGEEGRTSKTEYEVDA
jgi:hypothetical protein